MMYLLSLRSYSQKTKKKLKNKNFQTFFSNKLLGSAPTYIFIASVCLNMAIAHPPRVERTLYDQNWRIYYSKISKNVKNIFSSSKFVKSQPFNLQCPAMAHINEFS